MKKLTVSSLLIENIMQLKKNNVSNIFKIKYIKQVCDEINLLINLYCENY